jgi:hypothetical protein
MTLGELLEGYLGSAQLRKPVRLALRPVEQPAEEPDGGQALERRKGDRTSLTPRLKRRKVSPYL